jgi:hypothetical protein
MTASTPLAYAPRPRWTRRRRVRLMIVAVLLIAGVFAGIAGRSRIRAWYSRAQMLYYQRQCMGYVTPKGVVTYTNDQPLAQSLRGDPRYKTLFQTSPGKFEFAQLRVEHWESYNKTGHLFGGGPAAVHGLSGPSGQKQLVALDLFTPGPTQVEFVSFTIPRRTFYGTDESWMQNTFKLNVPPNQTGQPLTLLAAEFDAANPARFKVPYRLGQTSGVLTWKLNEVPYPMLELESAEGPLKLP